MFSGLLPFFHLAVKTSQKQPKMALIYKNTSNSNQEDLKKYELHRKIKIPLIL